MLVSWAVPKGPTLDPEVKRMAVHVEDHPLDYFDFEGVIPAASTAAATSSCGTGARGRPPTGEDPLAAIEAGELHVDLHGEKLARPLRARPARQAGARSSGCCSTSTTSTRSPAGTPRTTPAR